MLRKIRILVSLVSFVLLFVYCLAFAARNSASVSVDFLFGSTLELPVAVLIGLAVMCGALLGVIAGVASVFSKKREIRRLEKQLKAATAVSASSLAKSQ